MQTETFEALSEAECASRLSGMFRDADVPQHWPARTSVVAEVLREGGAFDVNHELLESWARSGSVGRVKIHGGGFSWTPGNMLAAAALANSSRRWFLDPKHVPKMTGVELAELQARAVGESVFSDLSDVDIQTLIGVIANTEDGELRNTLSLGLLAKLRADGAIA